MFLLQWVFPFADLSLTASHSVNEQILMFSSKGVVSIHLADAFIQSDFQYTIYKGNPLEQAGVKCLTRLKGSMVMLLGFFLMGFKPALRFNHYVTLPEDFGKYCK